MHRSLSFYAVLRRPARAVPALALAGAILATPGVAAAQDWPMVGGDPAHAGSARGPEPPFRRAWESRIAGAGPAAGPVVAAGAVVVVGWDRVAALEAGDGSRRWEIARAEGPAGPPLIAEELVVFAEGRGTRTALVAVSVEDGEEAWRAPMRATVAGGLTGADGRIYLGARDGSIRALEVETGEEVWRFEREGRVETAPAVSDDLVIAAVEDFQTGEIGVHALDAGSGRPRWSMELEGPAIGLSSAAVAGDVAVIGLGTFRTLGLDLGDGAERWSQRLRSPYSARFVPVGWDDVLIGDRTGHLYRLDPATGEQRWVYRVPGHLLVGSPVVVDGAAVVGDGAGRISAISLDRGHLVWHEDTGGRPVGALASDGERLYAAPHLGPVIAYEHDPDGVPTDEPSPTTLFVDAALLNFAMAAVPVGILLFLLFSRLRSGRPDEPIVAARSDGNGAGGGGRG